ncbi:Helicase [Vibrio aestuarianus]|uniref:DEAD/DEAH box helicase n=1 Tax=Vibrio aestuarianus TaxID=28171 RepID=UPI0014560A62|nr:DEAD/DEAH box helicase family protein [Vibrio aestuarianus]NLS63588.1 DEAD/DEAH box helicase family protein [Vibrio aestuarianus subsp. francensis]CAH8188512.1 Helicase [Vibrio aestuarianus]
MSYFLNTPVNIESNQKLRNPQIEAYIKIQDYFQTNPSGEALVVLPTGTGKSGLISIAPFGVCKSRVLIITPGLVTKQSIQKTQEVLDDNFWVNFDIMFNPQHLPVISEYSSGLSDNHLIESHIIYSNIQRLSSNRDSGLLNRNVVDHDFFDMIIVDEAHHAPASTWQEVLDYFPKAKKLHVTGTPYRGDNQTVPGDKIHETPLSEVMRDRYVKWLRKETVNASELYFTLAEQPGVKLTKDEVLQFKEKEWLEKSVALSKPCSLDVIDNSIQRLHELNELSPNIPHKILAVGCSITHAEDLLKWYKGKGLESVIVHSEMSPEDLENAFETINRHDCQVVISVNMLMEGYDHRYLTILALFRPYRSINAFAQVVGRVLRAIPEEEITAFEVDNNAIIIFHEETGLDFMWKKFQQEVERAKQQRVRDYTGLSRDYSDRSNSLADISSEDAFISDKDSYLGDMDFNDIFEKKRAEIGDIVSQKLEALKQLGTFDDDDFEVIKNKLIEKETNKISSEIDPALIEKRPDLARKRLRELLTKKAQDETASLLSDLGIDEKSCELAPQFMSIIPYLKPNTPNDGVLVRYINTKLAKKYGRVNDRDNKTLLNSINQVPSLMDELRKMLSC